MINKRFFHYVTRAAYESERDEVPGSALVFIDQPPAIIRGGVEYTAGGGTSAPFILDDAILSEDLRKFDMGLLPPKAEMVEAWDSGRPVRFASRNAVVSFAHNEDMGTAQLNIMLFMGATPCVGSITMKGSAESWGYNMVAWNIWQIEVSPL